MPSIAIATSSYKHQFEIVNNLNLLAMDFGTGSVFDDFVSTAEA